MDLLSQNPIVSEDPETRGFDISAGSTWIYPENYPVREYQFNIVKNALYNNTLVSLPTGKLSRSLNKLVSLIFFSK